MSSHPGSTLKEAVELAEYLREFESFLVNSCFVLTLMYIPNRFPFCVSLSLMEPLERLALELTKEVKEMSESEEPHHEKTIKVRTIAIDITDEKKLSRFAEVLMIRNAGISVLVNCAGTGIYGEFEKQSRSSVFVRLPASCLANSFPIPEDAPVIIAIFIQITMPFSHGNLWRIREAEPG